jgi:hypothetical protein
MAPPLSTAGDTPYSHEEVGKLLGTAPQAG